MTKPAPDPGVKKPSLISQVFPYLLTAAFLVFVFTGLKSNVIDEPHRLTGTQWSALQHGGVKADSIEVMNDDDQPYCAPAGKDPACSGPDFEVRPETDDAPAALRRTPGSRIPDGATVRVNYVKKVEPADVWATVSEADLTIFLPVMVLHILIFFLGDILSFGLPYRWFSAPDMTWREIAECRGAPYVIQVAVAPLAEALFPLYLWRVKKIPVTESLSTNLMTILLDFSVQATVVSVAVLYNLFGENLAPSIGAAWLILPAAYLAVFYGGLVLLKSPLTRSFRRRLEDRRAEGSGGLGGGAMLLRSFGLAEWRRLGIIFAVRVAMMIASFSSSYAALRAMGVHPEPALAFIGIPIVVLSVFLPLGVGGYGGPQLIAWFLFVKLGGAGTADQVIAYSLLWSTSFLIGRAVIGLIFIRGFWRRTFPNGFTFSDPEDQPGNQGAQP